MSIRVALIQDWLTEMGGAEKVFASLLKIFPDADVYTLTYNKNVINKLGIPENKIKGSFISKLPFGRTKYRHYLPLFPKAIESFDLSGYNLIISSSYSVAKGVLTNSNQVHICYCHSPVRYAWDLYHQYLKESNLSGFGLKALYVRHTLHKLRIWDIISANRVDYFIANSNYIQKRIQKVYRRDSVVVYPPVDISRFELEEVKEDYYFTASRLVPYKKIDLIAEAFSCMSDKRLVIAGTGPDYDKIKGFSKRNVTLLGYVDDAEMVRLMQKARCFVFAADEDFGIVPVEAQACGTPVICLGRGGTKETVIDGITGVHFKEQVVEDLIDAVERFENNSVNFSARSIRTHAEQFSEPRFVDEVNAFVNTKTSL